jgi:hypothetical protein
LFCVAVRSDSHPGKGAKARVVADGLGRGGVSVGASAREGVHRGKGALAAPSRGSVTCDWSNPRARTLCTKAPARRRTCGHDFEKTPAIHWITVGTSHAKP